ncbi:MAG: hypothetical protein Q4F47_02915 [Bacteroidaceae bacterium]|nr:hypothetical protein [Bacteroidaceae bacterium]MDO5481986.1 hypothetical protein [Bacteroidaceae bacterium]
MKKFTFLAALTFAALLSSCGGSKQTVYAPIAATTPVNNNQIPQNVAVASEPCDDYAFEAPAKRASGVGTHFKEATATNLAQLNARANLAKALQQCVETATKNYADAKELFSADEASSAYVTDQSVGADDREAGWAKELIKGAPVVKKTRYKTPNNQWEIHVCVEYQESVAEMAAEITKVFNEKLTQEQKARIDFNEQKFLQEMKEAMGDYKGATMQ